MLGNPYIYNSAGDTVKRPLEAQGDRPHRPDKLESNLLFALVVSALAASFWCTESSSCTQPWKSGPGRVASRSPSHPRAGVVLQRLSLHIQVSQWVKGTAALPALSTTPDSATDCFCWAGVTVGPKLLSPVQSEGTSSSTSLAAPASNVCCVSQSLNRIKCCCSTLLEGKGHASWKKLVGESSWSLWQPPITRARNVLIREALFYFFFLCVLEL